MSIVEAEIALRPRNASPLAESVSSALRRAILAGEHAPGSPLPSERALSQRHSVSRTVIREAVALLASDGLLLQSERCRPVVAKPAKKRNATRAARFGVWLWPRADDYTAAAIFRGVQRSAREREVRLVVGTASHLSWEDDVASEARFLRSLFEDEHADGAILWYLGGERNLPVLREAREAGVALVFVDRLPPKGFDADFVGTENVGSARAAVEHLVELGHSQIVFVGNRDTASPVAERYEGYRRAMEDAGLDASPARLPIAGETESASIRRIAESILDQKPRPTAIFAVNDSVALELIATLRLLGVAVPEGISVVGFDGLLHPALEGGSLTTARQRFTAMGEFAGETLLARLDESRSAAAYRHILLDAPLRPGETTAPLSTPLIPTRPAQRTARRLEVE